MNKTLNKVINYGLLVVSAGALICLLSTTIGCVGPEGIQGRDGVAGQSVVGPAGANGVNGTNGTNGADATPVIVVNLCPGVSNYGVFVETAICLNNNLYGVYSANGGFLTLLAPGAYSSNAIGSACNLVVGPNCTVTH